MVPAPASYWHTTPLQFLPALLTDGALRASVHPRPTALARRRKLGLTGYLHLSLVAHTPLLADKLQKGYPHALLAFDPAIAELPGAAYLRYNTKRWGHRDDFIPITDPGEKADFLAQWRTGKFPSAELLIPETLSLTHATGLYLADQAHADWLARFPALSTPPMQVAPERFPPGAVEDLTQLHAWADDCQHAGRLLEPPKLPFD